MPEAQTLTLTLRARNLSHMPPAGTLTLNGRNLRGSLFLRSISSVSDTQYTTYGDEETVMSVVLDIVQSDPNNKSVWDALDRIREHRKVQISPRIFEYQVFSKVLDIMQNLPGVDPYEVYVNRGNVRLHLFNPEKYRTKDQIMSRVFDILKTHPNVCPSKVTEDTHFIRDLGFGELDFDHSNVVCQLQTEFKLFIPSGLYGVINSVKSATDYVYDHLDERLSRKEFLKIFFFGPHMPPATASELERFI